MLVARLNLNEQEMLMARETSTFSVDFLRIATCFLRVVYGLLGP